MKKHICAALVVLSFISLTGCSLFKPSSDAGGTPKTGDNSSASTSEVPGNTGTGEAGRGNGGQNGSGGSSTSYTINDYYPFKENTRYIYQGKGNEFAGYTKWVDYIKGGKIQERINNGGTELARVLENKNGELDLVFSKESFYREDFTSKQGSKSEILLKEPLVKGTSWTLSDGRKRYISNLNVDITTPSGKYKALEVTTEGKDSKTYDYYAPNVGLIQSLTKTGSDEINSSLMEIQTDAVLTQNVKLYYPNPEDSKIYYVEQKASFKTNDITKFVFEKQFRDAPKSDLMKLISPNTRINSMYLNNDGMVYLDFSKEFTSEMNLGASFESMVLQSIANTAGEYYGVKKVYITIENQPYKSGHILMKKGEAFTVDTKNCVKHP